MVCMWVLGYHYNQTSVRRSADVRIPAPVQETLGSGLVNDLSTMIAKMEVYSSASLLMKTEADSSSPARVPNAPAPQRTLCRPEFAEGEKPLNPQVYLDLRERMSIGDFEANKVSLGDDFGLAILQLLFDHRRPFFFVCAPARARRRKTDSDPTPIPKDPLSVNIFQMDFPVPQCLIQQQFFCRFVANDSNSFQILKKGCDVFSFCASSWGAKLRVSHHVMTEWTLWWRIARHANCGCSIRVNVPWKLGLVSCLDSILAASVRSPKAFSRTTWWSFLNNMSYRVNKPILW